MSFAAATRDPAVKLTHLSTSWRAGATGEVEGRAVSGTALHLFDAGSNTWLETVANEQAADLPGALEWSTTDPALLDSLLSGEGREVAVAVAPAAPNGDGLAELASDYAEVRVRYRTSMCGTPAVEAVRVRNQPPAAGTPYARLDIIGGGLDRRVSWSDPPNSVSCHYRSDLDVARVQVGRVPFGTSYNPYGEHLDPYEEHIEIYLHWSYAPTEEPSPIGPGWYRTAKGTVKPDEPGTFGVTYYPEGEVPGSPHFTSDEAGWGCGLEVADAYGDQVMLCLRCAKMRDPGSHGTEILIRGAVVCRFTVD